MPVNRSMVCKSTVFSEHFPACAATPKMFTWGAPGTESVPGSWVWVPQVRFSTWVLGLGVPGSIFYLGLGFGCPRFDFLPGSWVCLFSFCHPDCPDPRRDRSGPAFSSAPEFGASGLVVEGSLRRFPRSTTVRAQATHILSVQGSAEFQDARAHGFDRHRKRQRRGFVH